MKKLIILAIFLIVSLSGCTAHKDKAGSMVVPLNDAPCNVTNTSWVHIYARHCQPGGGSRFTANYCNQASLQNLCTIIQTAPNAQSNRTVQPNGRIRYDVNLGYVVGTNQETCARLVTTSNTNGTVVTMFPELQGAPGQCQ